MHCVGTTMGTGWDDITASRGLLLQYRYHLLDISDLQNANATASPSHRSSSLLAACHLSFASCRQNNTCCKRGSDNGGGEAASSEGLAWLAVNGAEKLVLVHLS